MSNHFNLAFRLPAVVRQEGKWFYSSCPLLDVHSQGESREDALSSLKDALELFLVTCIEMGTLAQILREQGFTPGAPEVDEADSEYLDVPISLIAQRHVENRAH